MGSKRSRIRLSLKEYKLLCELIHERDGWKCKVCRFRQDLHAHHIIFRSHNGPDASYNLITICTDCHEAIHDRYVIIMAKSGDPMDIPNADDGVKIMRVNGWKPKRTVR